MARLELDEDEAKELREVIERYLPDLRAESADTDDKEFKAFLKKREAFMRKIIDRLQQAA
jgi:uncharacterized UPF0160 family protein